MTILEAFGWLLLDSGFLIVLIALAAKNREINITE